MVDRARELREKRDSHKGLRGKELNEWNRMKKIFGDATEDL